MLPLARTFARAPEARARARLGGVAAGRGGPRADCLLETGLGRDDLLKATGVARQLLAIEAATKPVRGRS